MQPDRAVPRDKTAKMVSREQWEQLVHAEQLALLVKAVAQQQKLYIN